MPDHRTRARESRAAIERLYIAMRHLFIRGSYKPLGVSGEAMIEALMQLQPEIYGSIAEQERVELKGLQYVMERLPIGIEECRHIRLISKEGYEDSQFAPIIPAKRRRNCFRIDDMQMYIEMTRGRSDIYDVLTHLTFLYIESEKIRRNSLDNKGNRKRDWQQFEELIQATQNGEEFNKDVAVAYLSTLLGRTYHETVEACTQFAKSKHTNNLFHIAYWLGRRAIEEHQNRKSAREISFSAALRDKVGHHVYGEEWANSIKSFLYENDLLNRPLHIISANLHSVMNSLYAKKALEDHLVGKNLEDIVAALSDTQNNHLQQRVKDFAAEHGMHQIDGKSGTNISVQIFDLTHIHSDDLPDEIEFNTEHITDQKPILLVMDYAFGEQAFETMDELLKPYHINDKNIALNVQSISVMGKAGILEGNKGDIIIPHAHVFEGTADNYPFKNDLTGNDFHGYGVDVYENGSMITVLGTSLQNRDVLRFFFRSSWNAIGLEMEGAHYQKAIQAASKIRGNISPDVVLRYAYYASDNPLLTGSTLASGSLGLDGVKPTYLVTQVILNKIFAN